MRCCIVFLPWPFSLQLPQVVGAHQMLLKEDSERKDVQVLFLARHAKLVKQSCTDSAKLNEQELFRLEYMKTMQISKDLVALVLARL